MGTESGDPASRYVPFGAAETAGLLVVEGRFSIVPEWLLDADVSDAAVRLYAVLLRFGATSGQRMPSRRTLADRLRKKSVDSVDRAMKELVAVGAVEVSHRTRDGVNLTNRYLVRSTPPGQPARPRRAGGGRTDAATPDSSPRAGGPATCFSARDVDARQGVGSRRSAARVAARMRPNRESLTENNPPPHPSSTPTDDPVSARPPSAAAPDALAPAPADRGEGADRRGQVLAVLGLLPSELADLAARCAQLRRKRGLPAALWTAGRLADVLATAVLDQGLPPAAAVPALLAIAADPATRSPARLRCPGPWWDLTPTPRAPTTDDAASAVHDDVQQLEAILAEVGGLRVVLQRQARAQLAAEGLPVTRESVARRAVDLLARPDQRPPAGS